jgi:hypothetical protein
MDDDSHTFQLLDVRIEDNSPKSLEYDDIDELLRDSFTDALNASKYSGNKIKKCTVFLFGRTDNGQSIRVSISVRIFSTMFVSVTFKTTRSADVSIMFDPS